MFIAEFGQWMGQWCEDRGYPEVRINWLEPKGKCISIEPTDAEIVEQEYINGSKKLRLEFDVLGQCEHNKRYNMMGVLLDIAEYLNDNCNWETSSSSEYRILKGTSTLPSMKALTDNGMAIYSFHCSLTYRTR